MSDDGATSQGGPTGPANDACEVNLHLAYAEASVMLIECLMIVMIEKKVLPVEALVDAVETALEAKQSVARDGTRSQIAAIAAGVLSKIANSLAATRQGTGAPHS